MIAGLCFDFGETLAYVEGVGPGWKERIPDAIASAAGAFGLDLEGGRAEIVRRALEAYDTRSNPREVEFTDAAIFSEALSRAGIPASFAPGFSRSFFDYFRASYRYYDDAARALAALRARGARIGLLTDVPYGMGRSLVEEDLGPVMRYLDRALTSVEVGFRKPNAAGYLRLAGELGLSPGDCAYVGNEEKDMAGANRAGMTPILVDRSGTLPPLGERFRISSLDGLVPLLEANGMLA